MLHWSGPPTWCDGTIKLICFTMFVMKVWGLWCYLLVSVGRTREWNLVHQLRSNPTSLWIRVSFMAALCRPITQQFMWDTRCQLINFEIPIDFPPLTESVLACCILHFWTKLDATRYCCPQACFSDGPIDCWSTFWYQKGKQILWNLCGYIT